MHVDIFPHYEALVQTKYDKLNGIQSEFKNLKIAYWIRKYCTLDFLISIDINL